MSQLPTVKQLRYFVALDHHEHFGRAAADCHVSQSAFSVAIRDLETLLGVQLVDRTNKQVTITTVGRRVAEQARLCLRDIEQLTMTAAEASKPLSGALTMGVIPTIAPFLLPRALPGIREAYPELKLFIREDTTDEIHAALIAGDLDLILIALPYPLRTIEVMPLFRDRFLLACRRDTERVDPENFSVNRVSAESILLLEDGHCLRRHALEACSIRNLNSINRFSATSLYTLIEMVDNDLGITFLPEMAVGSALLQQTRIATWPLAEDSYREIGLAWRRGTARQREFNALGDLIIATEQQRSSEIAR